MRLSLHRYIEALKIAASDADYDHFGNSVAVSGDYVIVGVLLVRMEAEPTAVLLIYYMGTNPINHDCPARYWE